MTRAVLIWATLIGAVALAVSLAAASPLLAWREPVYIIAGFAGIVAMAAMLFQPLLVAGFLPGLSAKNGRPIHRIIGGLIVAAVIVHVGGLWITSPPDVMDALLFVSATPFSVWGVIAMWAVFGSGALAVMRARKSIRLRLWRVLHTSLAVVIVAGTIIHALQIEGTMETASKVLLCVLLASGTLIVLKKRVTSRA